MFSLKWLRLDRRALLHAFVTCLSLSAVDGRARAAEFCALTVDIIRPDGSPARFTPVRFLDPAGKALLDETVESSTLRICDFGFGPHTLVIGHSYCHPVAFEGLRLRLDEPIHLIARLNTCSRDRWPGNLCSVYLRVRDAGGGRIGGALLRWNAPTPGATSDSMGRLAAFLVGGDKTTATVSKVGYVTSTLSLACAGSEDIEIEVVLEPGGN